MAVATAHAALLHPWRALTVPVPGPMIIGVTPQREARVERDELKKLESRLDELIGVVERLRHENHLLKSNHDTLYDRHNRLAEKTKIARERIESMIGRLKALERS